jgi:ANTAR domain-containing protein/GAF domain-containing protein
MGESLHAERGENPLRHVAEMFADLGQQLKPPGAARAFDVVASLAARRIGGARAASVTILKNGRFETVAATEERAMRADLIQYEIGAGPCVDAILEDSLLKTDDLHHDGRWPDYARLATELGWSSMLSYRLNPEVTSQDVLAGLNIYADRTHAFDLVAVEVGLLLATHGAMAVAAQSNLQRAENLEKALRTSREIGTAVGVLMATHKLTREQAFDLLRIASQNSNRKLADIAVEVVDTGTVPYPAASS